jgi:hypothetical protein
MYTEAILLPTACLSNAPRYLKDYSLFDGSQASTACPSDKSTIKIKINMEHWGNDTGVENRKLEEKSLPVPLYSPQISHGPPRESIPGLLCERLVTNCLMALKTKI